MKIYCVYLTAYRGNKLPPFYIGYSSVDKVKAGYRGSVSSKKYKSIWESELTDNPELFTTKIVSTYTSAKEASEKERYFQKALKATTHSMYINQSIYPHCDNRGVKRPDLAERNRKRTGNWVSWNKGISMSNETRTKLSKLKNGVKLSEVHKQNISKGMIGRKQTQETKDKLSRMRKGIPRTEEHKQRIREGIRLAKERE